MYDGRLGESVTRGLVVANGRNGSRCALPTDGANVGTKTVQPERQRSREAASFAASGLATRSALASMPGELLAPPSRIAGAASDSAPAVAPASDEQAFTQATAWLLQVSSQARRPSHARRQSVMRDWHAVLHCWVPARAVFAASPATQANAATATLVFFPMTSRTAPCTPTLRRLAQSLSGPASAGSAEASESDAASAKASLAPASLAPATGGAT
jgi:hypothetical protein